MGGNNTSTRRRRPIESAPAPSFILINIKDDIKMTRTNKKFSGVLPAGNIEGTAAVIEKLTAPTATAPALTTTLEYKGFNRGLAQVFHVDYSNVIGELREALGITSRSGLSAYRNGQVRLRADQAARVQQVFNLRGITEIWDA